MDSIPPVKSSKMKLTIRVPPVSKVNGPKKHTLKNSTGQSSAALKKKTTEAAEPLTPKTPEGPEIPTENTSPPPPEILPTGKQVQTVEQEYAPTIPPPRKEIIEISSGSDSDSSLPPVNVAFARAKVEPMEPVIPKRKTAGTSRTDTRPPKARKSIDKGGLIVRHGVKVEAGKPNLNGCKECDTYVNSEDENVEVFELFNAENEANETDTSICTPSPPPVRVSSVVKRKPGRPAHLQPMDTFSVSILVEVLVKPKSTKRGTPKPSNLKFGPRIIAQKVTWDAFLAFIADMISTTAENLILASLSWRWSTTAVSKTLPLTDNEGYEYMVTSIQGRAKSDGLIVILMSRP